MASGLFLIADDSEGKRLMLRALLRHLHWDSEILMARTTEEAKKLIDAHPDIAHAFIDYEMPSENGPAVIAYLKAKNPSARIALVSSSDSERYTSEAKAAGAEICICTSRESDEVEQTMKSVVETWKTIEN